MGATIVASKAAPQMLSSGKIQRAANSAGSDGERQTNSQQTQRQMKALLEDAQVDSGRIGEQNQDEGGFGELVQHLAAQIHLEQIEPGGSDQKAECSEYHRRGQGGRLQPS